MKFKKNKIIILVSITIILFMLWIAWGNKALMLSEITVKSDELPKSFSGYRIAQISDLHNAEFGDNNFELVKKLKEAQANIIVFTGDLVDSYDTNIDISIDFVKKALEIAPCYYVTGNHEARIEEFDDLINSLEELGVVVLQNQSVVLQRDKDTINLLGVQDPSFQTDYLFDDETLVVSSTLDELLKDKKGYTILLSHRPELFDIYASKKIDLVFSGHAHGGQFRLPFIGGVVAPGQGLFPKYEAGLYTEDRTSMVVSRGIGNSIIPFRVNNRPEIVVVELNRF